MAERRTRNAQVPGSIPGSGLESGDYGVCKQKQDKHQ